MISIPEDATAKSQAHRTMDDCTFAYESLADLLTWLMRFHSASAVLVHQPRVCSSGADADLLIGGAADRRLRESWPGGERGEAAADSGINPIGVNIKTNSDP